MTRLISHSPSEKWLLVKYWTPVLLYCGMIIYLSSQSDPSQHLPSFVFVLSDKLVHGVEYGILGILLYRAFHQTIRTLGSICLAIICAVAFGISDEFHQWYVPNRQAEIGDVLADTIGASVFVWVWVFLSKQYYVLRQMLHD